MVKWFLKIPKLCHIFVQFQILMNPSDVFFQVPVILSYFSTLIHSQNFYLQITLGSISP